jgi:protein O-GlcNAc transferase
LILKKNRGFGGPPRRQQFPGPTEQKLQQAIAFHQRGMLPDAKRLYEEILKQRPKHFDALHLLGVLACQTGDLGRGEELIAQAIKVDPDNALAYLNRGNALKDLRRLDDALSCYNKAVALKSNLVDAHSNRSIVLYYLKRLDEALSSYDRTIALKPDHAEAYNNRGIVLFELNRLEDALVSCEKAVALKPDYAEAYCNRGNTFYALKRLGEALASYDRAVALRPNLVDAHCNRGNTLHDLGRIEEALASCDKAIALNPNYPAAHNNRGKALYSLKRLDDAMASYDKAIALWPDLAEAHGNRAKALYDLGRLQEALVSCDKAIALKPDIAGVWSGRGGVLHDLGRLDDAFASYEKAVVLKPDLAEAWSGRASVLYDLRRLDDALAGYEKALAFDPDLFGAQGVCLHIKMTLCDWTNFDADCGNLISSVRQGKHNASPFGFLGVSATADDQLECARLWAATACPPSQRVMWQGELYHHDRIRVAYVSADFREHPVSLLMAGVLERHERSLFDVTAISLGPDDDSQMRRRVMKSVEHFIDARAFNDEQIASLVRSSEIDVLVDLTGFTAGSRTKVFSRRPAPIQVNYLGYAGTMGAPYFDYILADRVVIPEEKRASYSEKVVYLPNSYMANDSGRTISERPQRRSECGLPETGFVFCSFNNSYKITPEIFDLWMRPLREIHGSVLWLSETNVTANRNLRRQAESLGIDPTRLMFARRLPLNEDHLARLELADLFLDTLPFNAHTTAADALWAGLPVLTRLGETFAGRVAASLLNAVGLPELVTATSEIYEQTAIDLAREPAKLKAIKQKLTDNRLSTPLFNTELFTRHVEAAYTAMVRRHQSGLAPDHIAVPN